MTLHPHANRSTFPPLGLLVSGTCFHVLLFCSPLSLADPDATTLPWLSTASLEAILWESGRRGGKRLFHGQSSVYAALAWYPLISGNLLQAIKTARRRWWRNPLWSNPGIPVSFSWWWSREGNLYTPMYKYEGEKRPGFVSANMNVYMC